MTIAETYSYIGQNVPNIPKDPDAVLDYTFDWTDWLAESSDTISSSAVTASGCTVNSKSDAFPLVHVWVSGGTDGTVASVTCRIVTTGGRTDDRTIYLLIQGR